MFAPFSSLVSPQPQSCPVELLAKYLAMRGPLPGALFITVDGAPVCRSHFSNKLSSDIQFCGLSPQFTKGTVSCCKYGVIRCSNPPFRGMEV